ncbi:hypothetical protein [Chryseolinea lacunae]|uniref:Uncharacterized protein n=1 Tax=Chryseolinea lacunae TaxID=2801331 RepID=A0ABS1L391_9BACT|nr:hypothetical protein [Chryseolinea lacunae]MBL0745026.1 hypothetical protein [Chryseolinea lacunae]
MKYVDLAIQTLLFLAAAGVVITHFGAPDWEMGILLVQILLGPWQLLGSLAAVLLRTRQHELKVPHLAISWIYIFVLLVVSRDHVSVMLVTVPAWLLAAYYYVVTWKVALHRKHDGKFLPHLSF